MEGIDTLEPAHARAARASAMMARPREWRLVERWLIFMFLMCVIGMSMLAVAIAAMPTR